jgi:hypothetical protein
MEAVVLALQDELKKKNVKLVAHMGKFERIAYVVIVFVLGLAAGKFLWQ